MPTDNLELAQGRHRRSDRVGKVSSSQGWIQGFQLGWGAVADTLDMLKEKRETEQASATGSALAQTIGDIWNQAGVPQANQNIDAAQAQYTSEQQATGQAQAQGQMPPQPGQPQTNTGPSDAPQTPARDLPTAWNRYQTVAGPDKPNPEVVAAVTGSRVPESALEPRKWNVKSDPNGDPFAMPQTLPPLAAAHADAIARYGAATQQSMDILTRAYAASKFDAERTVIGNLMNLTMQRYQTASQNAKYIADYTQEIQTRQDAARAPALNALSSIEGLIGEYGDEQDVAEYQQLQQGYEQVQNSRDGLQQFTMAAQGLYNRLETAKGLAGASAEQAGKIELQKLKNEGKTPPGANATAKATEDSYGALQDAEGMIESIRDVRQHFEEYSATSPGGTGPIAGRAKSALMGEDTEQLNAAFRSINIQNLRTSAQGMSKLFDTAVERKAWEATQPQITNDDQTNRQILVGMEAIHMKHAQYKQEELAYRSAHKGSVVGFKPTPTTVLVSPDGQMQLMGRDQVAAAKDQGFITLDEYANMGPQKTKVEAGRVNVIGPNGERGTIDQSEVEAATQNGWKVTQ